VLCIIALIWFCFETSQQYKLHDCVGLSLELTWITTSWPCSKNAMIIQSTHFFFQSIQSTTTSYTWAHYNTTPSLPHSHTVAYEAGGRGGRPPLRLEKFRANFVFRASSSCSKILKDKKYFNTVKNFRANSVFRASAGCSKFWMIKNIYSIQWIQGTLCFSGKAQVAQKSWM